MTFLSILKKRKYLKRLMRSLYFSALLIPKKMRSEFINVYLLLRYLDDIVDHPELSLKEKNRLVYSYLRPLKDRDSLAYWPISEFIDNAPMEIIPILNHLLKTMRKAFLQDMKPRQFNSYRELDRYTYLVAGVVGRYLTEIYIYHYPLHIKKSSKIMIGLAVRYGKGLQLINVLRDLPTDLGRGFKYVDGISLNSSKEQLQPVVHQLRVRAKNNLNCGVAYLENLRHIRIRVAYGIPLWIGLYNLRHFEIEEYYNSFQRGKPIKSSKKELIKALAVAIIVGIFPRCGKWYFTKILDS